MNERTDTNSCSRLGKITLSSNGESTGDFRTARGVPCVSGQVRHQQSEREREIDRESRSSTEDPVDKHSVKLWNSCFIA